MRNKITRIIFFSGFLLISFFALIILIQKTQAAPKTLKSISHFHFKPVCDTVKGQNVRCNAKVVTQNDGTTPLASATPLPSSLGPKDFHTAYQLPCEPGGAVSSICNTPQSFGPRTIAIVDAYNDTNIENDLNVYSSYYGIPPCTKANGCLEVVNEFGTSQLPFITDSGWALETSLDVEVAHAICQTCKILLIETNSSSLTDLATGANQAAKMGANAISNSYGTSGEFSFEGNYDHYYNHPGIAVTASAGDSGYGVGYPSSSQYVVGVGGTTLHLFSDSTYSSESVWSDSGSGCSFYENANTWQIALPNWNLTGCTSKKAVSDISADADPNTGAAVYDSIPNGGQTGWWQVGGTSLSSPIIASLYVLGGGLQSTNQAASLLYENNNGLNFHDITSGSNGFCGTIMCKGATGFDGPTGLGTPNGLGGFLNPALATPTPTSIADSPTPTPTGVNPTPTPTDTPTSSPTPTSTPTPTNTPTPTPTPINQFISVSITSPTDGSTVVHSTIVNINAQTVDTAKITKVEFYVNGSLYSIDSFSPYGTIWIVPFAKNIKYTITAKAYDSLGRTAQNSITVTSI